MQMMKAREAKLRAEMARHSSDYLAANEILELVTRHSWLGETDITVGPMNHYTVSIIAQLGYKVESLLDEHGTCVTGHKICWDI